MDKRDLPYSFFRRESDGSIAINIPFQPEFDQADFKFSLSGDTLVATSDSGSSFLLKNLPEIALQPLQANGALLIFYDGDAPCGEIDLPALGNGPVK